MGNAQQPGARPYRVLVEYVGGEFRVEYPELNCRGIWSLVESDSRSAKFHERITEGTNRCTAEGWVEISETDLSDAFLFEWRNLRQIVNVTAILRKQ